VVALLAYALALAWLGGLGWVDLALTLLALLTFLPVTHVTHRNLPTHLAVTYWLTVSSVSKEW